MGRARRDGAQGVDWLMANCPQCGAVHMPGIRTCRVCGADLTQAKPAVVDIPPAESTPAESAPPDKSPLETVLAAETDESDLTLIVIGSGERIDLRGQSEYTLGRADPESKIYVDVDMSDHGGWDAGVSRRHARIFRQEGQFYLEDLRSANGTYLNETRLRPGQFELLHAGDMVKLGILRLCVVLKN